MKLRDRIAHLQAENARLVTALLLAIAPRAADEAPPVRKRRRRRKKRAAVAAPAETEGEHVPVLAEQSYPQGQAGPERVRSRGSNPRLGAVGPRVSETRPSTSGCSRVETPALLALLPAVAMVPGETPGRPEMVHETATTGSFQSLPTASAEHSAPPRPTRPSRLALAVGTFANAQLDPQGAA